MLHALIHRNVRVINNSTCGFLTTSIAERFRSEFLHYSFPPLFEEAFSGSIFIFLVPVPVRVT